MERIGFSLAGEGRGHAARVVALSQVLAGRFEIVYFCPEPAKDFITKHIPDAVIEPVPALNFVKNGHGIDYFRTLFATLKTIRSVKSDIRNLSERMRGLGLTALISDFEPYASWAAAHCGIPVLNLNHPGVILKYLSLSPAAWIAQAVAILMMPPAQKTLICSFYRGDVGPIIRRELREAETVQGDYYLVYAKNSSRERICSILERFPGESFRIFPDPEADFTKALIGCRGVIAPAGHQLLSESLFLGKPVLAIPQAGQYEQRLNARMLRLSGRGMGTSIRTLEKTLPEFFRRIDDFPAESKGLESFRFDDETHRTAGIIAAFAAEYAFASPGRRRQYNWFHTFQEKLETLKSLPKKFQLA